MKKFWSFFNVFILTAFCYFAFQNLFAAASAPVSDLLAIQNQVHSFYHDAWNELMIFISIMLGVIGVVIPLLITYLQNSNFKLQNKEMQEKIEGFRTEILKDAKTTIHEDVENLKIEIHKDVERETKTAFANAEKALESKINEFVAVKTSQIQKNVDSSTGMIFHVESNLFYDQKRFDDSIGSTLSAMKSYCRGEDLENYKICLDMLEHRVKSAEGKFGKDTTEVLSSLLKILKKPGIKKEFKDSLPEIMKSGLPTVDH